jgi:hypothetical protein
MVPVAVSSILFRDGIFRTGNNITNPMNPTKATNIKSARRPSWRRVVPLSAGCALASLCLAASSWSAQAADPTPAGAVYPAPTGGWTYIYDGDTDTAGGDGSGFTSLDGTWSHDNDSDTWDGSKIGGTLADGTNAPGGAMSITEDGITYLRMQDTGDPRIANFTDGVDNRKLYMGHDLSNDNPSDTLLDDGVTLTFRARIPTPSNTKGPIDALYPQGATGPTPYPAGGDGYLNSDGGKGNFGIRGRALGMITFSLCVPGDKYDDNDPSSTNSFAGLMMNRLATNVVANEVDFPNTTNQFRGVALDPTQWHEFWITIQADTNGVGTHIVSVYMDGSGTGTNLTVTAGDADDFTGIPYLAMGGTRTVESYALDVDFFAYKIGAEAPVGTTVEKPQFGPVSYNSGKIVITWTGGGTLQTTTTLPGGTWSDLTGTNSPATIATVDPARFYRVKK